MTSTSADVDTRGTGTSGGTGRRWNPARLVLVAAALMIAGLSAREFLANPSQLSVVILNGLTAASLYFLVASGFTLIFGLMRVTNLAHGALYLMGGYVGVAVYERSGNWLVALAGAAVALAIVGALLQRALLPIYGQELREALVTLGIAIIISDLILAVFGGQARDIPVPDVLARPVTIAGDLIVPAYRLFVIALAVVVGVALWALLRYTRFGMTVRAGVDDRVMVAASGTNIRVVFAVVFALGAGLAGASGVIGGSFLSLQPGEDTRYLLYSLVVVIVGGLGSVPGAVLGALLVGLVDNLAAYYLPTWSTLITFGLLVAVLVVRPQGLLGRDLPVSSDPPLGSLAGVPLRRRYSWMLGLAVVAFAVALPWLASAFVLTQLVTKALWLGVAALSLVFLTSFVGMVSLAQTVTYGVAGYVVASASTRYGLDPWLSAGLGVLAAVLFGVAVGAVAARSRGVYLLMLTLAIAVFMYYFALQNRGLTGGFGGINGIRAPHLFGYDLGSPVGLYFACLAVAVAAYLGVRYLRRTPLGLAFQGVRDSDRRMSALGYATPQLRIAAFALAGLIAGLAGVLSVWYNGQISPGSIDLQRTIDLLVIAVIGGMYRLEGAFVGALTVTFLANYADVVTGRVNTLIGACFVLVLVVSPGGITGAVDRVRRRTERSGSARTAPHPPPPTESGTAPASVATGS